MTGRPGNATMEYLGAVGKQRQDVLPAAEARFPRPAADAARTIFAGLDPWIRLTLTARRPVQEGISSMTAERSTAF